MELLSKIATIIAGILVLMAAGTVVYGKFHKEIESFVQSIRDIGQSIRDIGVLYRKSIPTPLEARLFEAREMLREQEIVLRTSSLVNIFLTTCQYVIGGVLASSFVQEALSSDMVGGLGVLVLLSQLIHKQFRPDLKHVTAKEMSIKLNLLIREVENKMYYLRWHPSGNENDGEEKELLSMVTITLNKIENMELTELKKQIAQKKGK